jgi:hypothetical protein
MRHRSSSAGCGKPEPRAKRPPCLPAGSQPAPEVPRRAKVQGSASPRATARARTSSRGRHPQRAPRHEGAATTVREPQHHVLRLTARCRKLRSISASLGGSRLRRVARDNGDASRRKCIGEGKHGVCLSLSGGSVFSPSRRFSPNHETRESAIFPSGIRRIEPTCR